MAALQRIKCACGANEVAWWRQHLVVFPNRSASSKIVTVSIYCDEITNVTDGHVSDESHKYRWSKNSIKFKMHNAAANACAMLGLLNGVQSIRNLTKIKLFSYLNRQCNLIKQQHNTQTKRTRINPEGVKELQWQKKLHHCTSYLA